MDLDGDVEGDPGYNEINDNGTPLDTSDDFSNIRNNAHAFATVLFPFSTPFDMFPSFGGNVGEYYFELPGGVSSIRFLTIFDDHSIGAGTCVTGSASFGIYTGPEFLGAIANDGAVDIYPTSVTHFVPGDVVPADPLDPIIIAGGIVELTDLVYGDENLLGVCTLPYDNLRGTNAGSLPFTTGGLAGVPSMALGLPDPFAVYGTLGGSADCDLVAGPETLPPPVYPDPAPGTKRPFPGFQSIGCGGALTVEFSADALPVAGNGPIVFPATRPTGPDIIVMEVGFAEDPVAAVGSSTSVGPVNTDTNGGPVINCAGDPFVDASARGQANIVITNDTEPFYQSGGSPPFGFEFEQYKIKVVDGSGFYADQIQEFTAGSDVIPPDFGLNTKTLGPYDVTCQSVFYLYIFGDDGGFGNPDDDNGDGIPGVGDHPEQIFASNYDLAGVSFLAWTGITPEPTIYDPTALLEAGPPTQVLSGGGGAASWNLYAFGTGQPVGTASIVTPITVDVRPNTINLGSKGEWISVHIETSGDLAVEDIDPASVNLSGEAAEEVVFADMSGPVSIADGNSNGKSDLTVKIPRLLLPDVLFVGKEILITIRGKTFDGSDWSGQDIIKVVEPK